MLDAWASLFSLVLSFNYMANPSGIPTQSKEGYTLCLSLALFQVLDLVGKNNILCRMLCGLFMQLILINHKPLALPRIVYCWQSFDSTCGGNSRKIWAARRIFIDRSTALHSLNMCAYFNYSKIFYEYAQERALLEYSELPASQSLYRLISPLLFESPRAWKYIEVCRLTVLAVH